MIKSFNEVAKDYEEFYDNLPYDPEGESFKDPEGVRFMYPCGYPLDDFTEEQIETFATKVDFQKYYEEAENNERLEKEAAAWIYYTTEIEPVLNSEVLDEYFG